MTIRQSRLFEAHLVLAHLLAMPNPKDHAVHAYGLLIVHYLLEAQDYLQPVFPLAQLELAILVVLADWPYGVTVVSQVVLLVHENQS